MNRWIRMAAAASLALALGACAHLGTPGKERVVLQVSDENPRTWNQALNNARNLQQEFGKDNVDIRLVVYGNGIDMLKLESPVANRVKEAVDSGVAVVACENTMKARKLTRADMLPAASYVRGGIVEIIERQRAGYVYLRP